MPAFVPVVIEAWQYTVACKQVRGSPVINSDETSARLAGRTHWQWVFQTAEASYHVIAPSRGGEVIDALLAGAEPEVWGSDLWAPQILTAADAHQVCLSHQERDLTFAVDAGTGEARPWAIELAYLEPTDTRAGAASRLAISRRTCYRLLERGVRDLATILSGWPRSVLVGTGLRDRPHGGTVCLGWRRAGNHRPSAASRKCSASDMTRSASVP